MKQYEVTFTIEEDISDVLALWVGVPNMNKTVCISVEDGGVLRIAVYPVDGCGTVAGTPIADLSVLGIGLT